MVDLRFKLFNHESKGPGSGTNRGSKSITEISWKQYFNISSEELKGNLYRNILKESYYAKFYVKYIAFTTVCLSEWGDGLKYKVI